MRPDDGLFDITIVSPATALDALTTAMAHQEEMLLIKIKSLINLDQ